MNIKFLVVGVAMVLALTACSQQTKDQAKEATESAKQDVAAATAEVAKEAENAAQEVANATTDTAQKAVEAVGANTEETPSGEVRAEDKVSEDQKY